MKTKLHNVDDGDGGDAVNPFVDPELYRRHVGVKKREFEDLLAMQRGRSE